MGAMKEAPVFWQIAVGQLCGAGLLATVLSWKGVANAAEGFKAGALVGVLMSLFFGFMTLGTMNTTTMNAAVVDAAVSVVWMGTAGVVVSFVYNSYNTYNSYNRVDGADA